MLLPFPHSWPVRCAKCGHTGTVADVTADLAAQAAAVPIVRPSLTIRAGDHRPRAATGRRASQQAAALIGDLINGYKDADNR